MYPSGFDYLTEDFGTSFAIAYYVGYYLVMLGLGIAAYILQSISLYAIAKRRGIKKPWLSWLPIGNMWMLGCISDQYRYVAKGQVKNKRKSLMILTLAVEVLVIAVIVVGFGVIVQAITMGDSMTEAQALGMLGQTGGMLFFAFAMLGVAIPACILQYMALYDLYRSCHPNFSVMYLMLSIFVSMAMPVCLFICRMKDQGMPPRRERIVEQPQQEPWEKTSEE